MGRTPAKKRGRQGRRDTSPCSARPAAAPAGSEQGPSSHQGLGEHSAPGHRHVTTQRRPLTTLSPVGLSSVELGQTGPQAWCLLSVPGPLGQRDRPGHGKGPVALGTPRAGRGGSRFGSESAGGRQMGRVRRRTSRAAASDRGERAGAGTAPHWRAQGCVCTATFASQAAPPEPGKASTL